MQKISHVCIATVNAQNDVIADGALVMEDGKILWVGERTACPWPDERMEALVDGGGNLLMPGIVNAHTHTVYFLARGLGMDRDLKDWLEEATWPYLAVIEPEDAYRGAYLGYLENMRSGVTCLVDNFYMPAARKENADAVLRAMRDTGIRGVLARGYHDTPFNVPPVFLEEGEEVAQEYARLLEAWQGGNGGRIRLWMSPVNLLYCSPQSVKRVYEVGKAYGVGIHTHVAEARFEVEEIQKRYGKTFLEMFAELGVLDNNFHSVHSVWLSEREMELLAEAGGSVMFNPASNMLLASGIAPVETMREKGVRVALGTDAPNNNQDMLESMKLAALLPRMERHNPLAVSSGHALRMATIEGARALGMEGEIGSLEAGKQADLVLVNMHSLHNVPIHDPVANLVYAANQSDVSDVWLAGERVLENGAFTRLDEAGAIEQVEQNRETLARRAKEFRV